ncbi:MAG: DUF2953 domain-containing protein [Bacillota bacterium]
MGVWAVILVAVSAVILVLGANLLLPVRFAFFATFSGTRFEYDARLRLPLIPWYIGVPKLRAVRARQGPERPSGEAAAPVHERLGAIWRGIEAFRSHYREISSLASYVARAITVEELHLDIALGLDEAAGTALLAGAMQSAASMGVGLLCRQGIRFSQRPRVRVTPAYNRLCLTGKVRVRASVVPLRGVIAFGRLRSHLIKAKRLSNSVVSNRAGWNTRA